MKMFSISSIFCDYGLFHTSTTANGGSNMDYGQDFRQYTQYIYYTCIDYYCCSENHTSYLFVIIFFLLYSCYYYHYLELHCITATWYQTLFIMWYEIITKPYLRKLYYLTPRSFRPHFVHNMFHLNNIIAISRGFIFVIILFQF